MIRYAEPAAQHMTMLMSSYGLGSGVFERIYTKSVRRYLIDTKKRRERFDALCPKCLDIAKSEVGCLKWGDECLEKFVVRMFNGADVSQLESFYARYQSSRNKPAFFLYFVKHEL